MDPTEQLLISELPKSDQEYFQKIFAIGDPIHLSQEQIDFLRARRDYLTTEHKRIFANILEDKVEEEDSKKKSKSQKKSDE